jgi:transcriptional regulator with XRE-family HTH domain
MDLVTAVNRLREALGMSQQAFANELGLSIRAIANYEKDRRPKPKVLALLQGLAAKHGQPELDGVFRAALHEDLGLPNRFGLLNKIEAGEVYLLVFALIDFLERGDATDKEKVEEACHVLYRIVAKINQASPSGTIAARAARDLRNRLASERRSIKEPK